MSLFSRRFSGPPRLCFFYSMCLVSLPSRSVSSVETETETQTERQRQTDRSTDILLLLSMLLSLSISSSLLLLLLLMLVGRGCRWRRVCLFRMFFVRHVCYVSTKHYRKQKSRGIIWCNGRVLLKIIAKKVVITVVDMEKWCGGSSSSFGWCYCPRVVWCCIPIRLWCDVAFLLGRCCLLLLLMSDVALSPSSSTDVVLLSSAPFGWCCWVSSLFLKVLSSFSSFWTVQCRELLFILLCIVHAIVYVDNSRWNLEKEKKKTATRKRVRSSPTDRNRESTSFSKEVSWSRPFLEKKKRHAWFHSLQSQKDCSIVLDSYRTSGNPSYRRQRPRCFFFFFDD